MTKKRLPDKESCITSLSVHDAGDLVASKKCHPMSQTGHVALPGMSPAAALKSTTGVGVRCGAERARGHRGDGRLSHWSSHPVQWLWHEGWSQTIAWSRKQRDAIKQQILTSFADFNIPRKKNICGMRCIHLKINEAIKR